jgi:hypothetical protein
MELSRVVDMLQNQGHRSSSRPRSLTLSTCNGTSLEDNPKRHALVKHPLSYQQTGAPLFPAKQLIQNEANCTGP